MIARLLSTSLALLASLGVSHAQLSLDEAPLSVKLVPEQSVIARSSTFTVAVVLTHAPKAHTYWLNPGGPGKPTTLKWTLPEGFTASEPQWPTPHLTEFASFKIYGYEEEVAALVKITTPANMKPGEPVKLSVIADALVCTEGCRPIKVNADLTLATGAAPVTDAAQTAIFASARKKMAVAPAEWTLSAEKGDKGPVLVLSPSAGAAEPSEIYFFSLTPDIDSQAPQAATKEGTSWRLPLAHAEGEEAQASLTGIIEAKGGWLKADPEVKAFTVNAKIGEKPSSAAATTTPLASGASTAATPSSGPVTNGHTTPMLLLFAFLGGLILNVMPCVFPVIGIKIMGFVNQAGENKRGIFLHGVAYTFGVLISFWTLALMVKLLGLSWGGLLQQPSFVLFLGFFFLAFGLNMAGVFEIGTSAVGLANTVQHKSGLGRSFFDGLLATIVATPCSAPFLAPALAWALSLSTPEALLVFTLIGLGLSSPYLILSLAPGLVKLLPRPGAWMESFKQGMSFLLFATAGYMIWILAGLVDEGKLLGAIFGTVLVGFACWVYGRWFLPYRSVKAQRLGLLFTGIALAAAFWLGWPPAKSDVKLNWAAWTPETVPALVDQGDLVYVDFTARWCSTCQVNKLVYKDPKIAALFAKHEVQLVKADWTDNNPQIEAELKKFDAVAVPVNVLFSPNHHPIVINNGGLLNAQMIKDALAKLGKS
jgi:thiol:disulfide interchange protein DsbD